MNENERKVIGILLIALGALALLWFICDQIAWRS